MLKLPKVATPPAAVAVVTPDRAPAAGFVPITTVTLPVNPVTRFPCASRALTWTGGAITWPATALLGCPVNTSCVAVPTRTLKALLVAPVSPVAAAVSV